MSTARLIARSWAQWLMVVVVGVVFSGCGGGGGGGEHATIITPPPPALSTPLGWFSVATENYVTKYTAETAPFPASSQFANQHYPVPVSYQTVAPGPSGFDLVEESELAVETWGQADPRVSIVSGVAVGKERIRVLLVDHIDYNGMNNILGLTKQVNGGSNPHFEVYVTTMDPLAHVPMSNSELAKTLTHEFGHTLGLGHSPTQYDLMYYKANGLQGETRRTFLTLGDALALWSTLNNRNITWVEERPIITKAGTAIVATAGRSIAQVTDDGGEVVCVYTRP